MNESDTPAKVGLEGLGVLPESYPPPHARYLLERAGVTFTATPCYGMHAPWWIVRTLLGEAAPEPMQDGDKWRRIAVHADGGVLEGWNRTTSGAIGQP